MSKIPRVGQLVRDIPLIARRFMDPRQLPWEALDSMVDYMRMCSPREKEPRWPDCMPRLNRDTMGREHASSYEVTIERPIHVLGGEGLNCDSGVTIVGPVYIGRKVTIRRGAVITGPCYIGDEVTIGAGCRVKSSAIFYGTEIVFGTFVSHALIGANAHIGPSAILNDRHPRGKRIQIDGVKTKHVYLGPMIGDEAGIDGGACLPPGLIVMPRSIVFSHNKIRRACVYTS